MKKLSFSFAALFLLILTTLSCQKKEENIIKIGEYGSMTGAEATYGVSTHRGIAMVVEKVNQEGGINGKQIKLISMDDQGKPEEAATVVTKLITQDKVVAVLGEVASSRSLAGAPICQNYKIPMISPSSTNPRVTQVGDYIFRTCFIDPFQGKVVATFARKNLNLNRAAILKDIKNDYSIGLSEFFKTTFTELGGLVIDEFAYSAGDIDFKAQLTGIKAKKPDCLFVPGYYTEVALIARQARELGINAPLLGGDGWDSARLVEIAGKALENSYFSNHYAAQDPNPRVQSFIKAYQERWGEIPDGLAALGYEAAALLVDALKRTKSLNPKDIRDAIAATQNFETVTGTISMDANRNSQKSAVMIKIENGRFQHVATVAPQS